MEENVEITPPTSPPIERICLECNVKLKAGRAKFCSYEHKWEYLARKWQIPCENCAKIFTLPVGRRNHYHKFKGISKVFCSVQCFQQFWKANVATMRVNKIKENQNNVQPNILQGEITETSTEKPTDITGIHQ